MPLFNGRIHRNPQKYSNPHVLAKAIDEYVTNVEETVKITYNKAENRIVLVENPPSVAGLALFLGFSSKRMLLSLMNSNNPTVSNLLQTAFLWIESFYIGQALQPSAPKAYETMLKAMGYGNESVETMKVSRTVTGSTGPGDSSDSGDGKTTFTVEFIRPSTQLSEDEIRRQLLLEAGDDMQVVNSIESQLSNKPKVIDAHVERQPMESM